MRACPALAVLLLAACGADIDRSNALVTDFRILAVRGDPAESAPGAPVAYSVLAVSPGGPVADAAIDWSFCTSAARAAEDSPVSSACIAGSEAPAATGSTVDLDTPADACRSFGPLGMPSEPGKAPSQPAAPDATGGYRQPIRLLWHGGLTFAFERLTCSPTGVSLDLAQAFRDARRPNLNPQLLSLATSANPGGALPGDRIEIAASWSASSWESYVDIDLQQGKLVTRSEKLWLAWFATAGRFEEDFSAPEPATTGAPNYWRAPTQGTYDVWAVLHDDRGGVDYAHTAIVVR